MELASKGTSLFSGRPIGVRINRLSGAEGRLDIEALRRASRSVTFACVIPTEVKSAIDLVACVSALRQCRVVPRDIVPIVETRRGIAALEEIMEAALSVITGNSPGSITETPQVSSPSGT